MKYSYSNAQMREADKAAIAGGVPAKTLMERAGKVLADALEKVMTKLGIDDVLFVCGGGNNGGDGFVAARILSEREKDVAVLCLAENFSDECEAAKETFKGDVFGMMPRRRYMLIADCLFGTGLSRAPEGDNAALIEFINQSGAYVVACDLPSGLGESGIAFQPCVRADETLTIGQVKHALLLSDGADCAGKISTADIGIAAPEKGAEIWEKEDVAKCFPKRKSNTHKGSYGDACILAGSTYTGAAFLSAGACLKTGAGFTRLRIPKEMYASAIGKLPACILKEYDEIDGEILASDCVAVGMGAGVSERLYEQLTELLAGYTGTLVLDADALNTLAGFDTDILKTKICEAVVTPHPMEFARITGKSIAEVLQNPVSLAQEFAREYGVTVVLKNNRTVITDGVRTAINLTGSPALAKGGSGDILSGFLAGTLARGIAPFEAACVSTYVLGKAGEYAAEELGEYAPDATDIIGYIPSVMRDIVS